MPKFKQTILKVFFWTVVTTIIFGLVYLFLSYYDKENTILPWFWQNQNYLSFLYISIIIWYTFYISQSRFSRVLLWFIVVSNFFVAGRFFMNGQVWFSRYQFLMLFGMLIAGLLVSYIKYRIRYILITLLSGWFLVILLTSVLPIYDQPLNIQKFYDIQPIKLNIVLWDANKDISTSNALISLKNINGERKIIIDLQNSENIISQNLNSFNDTQITFSSTKKLENTNLIITTNNWIQIMLKSQSAISLVKTWNSIIWNTLAGKTDYYISQKLYEENEKMYSGLNISPKENQNIFASQIKSFEDKKTQYLTNLVWWNFVLNPTVDVLIKNYITILMNIDQNKYSQNMMNYNEYHKYLQVENKIYWYENNQQQDINSEVFSNTENWINQTQFAKTIYDWFK